MTTFLEARQISKHFPGVQALDRVSLRLGAGEVLAIVGENGAGKSTLMKVLAGVHRPDAGEVHLDGQRVEFAGVAEAMRRGIVLIHQELNLAENLSIAANLFLGRELVWGGPLGWMRQREMNDRARELLARVGLEEPPTRITGELPLGQRQLVEIARALSLDARLIIMDEPTSSLTQRETDRLYEVIDDLRAGGVAVLYISHRLAEVKRVADRVTVLRDGKNSGELAREEVTHDALVRLMVGRDLKQLYPRTHKATASGTGDTRVAGAEALRSPGSATPGVSKTPPRPPGQQPGTPVRLAVKNLTFLGGRAPLSLELRGGEITGMAGLIGAGRTEFGEALFGLRSITGGEIVLDGTPIRPRTPALAINAGILLVPEDRRRYGLVLTDDVRGNLSLPNLDALSVLTWVLRGKEMSLVRRLMDRLRVRASGPSQIVGQLSGGNQQKVVLGKWLARTPRVLILDEPTRGVDVGARSEIYALMDELAGQGVAILMISSDLEEVLGMSDRVLVLHEGRLAGELPRERLSEEAVMSLATGGAGGPHTHAGKT